MNMEFIPDNEALIIGCNKCISSCPVDVNKTVYVNGQNKIHINSQRRIHCGESIYAYDSHTHEFHSDTERFFTGWANGIPITQFTDPAIRHNIPQYYDLFSSLQFIGISDVYDVSFGADSIIRTY